MRLRMDDDGGVTVFAGTYSHGQGHLTVYSQLVNEFLGVDFDKVRLVDGDTGLAPKLSVGTFGSRSSMVGGAGIKLASEAIVLKGKKIAAHLLQSDAEKVVFEKGIFKAGAGSVTLAEVAEAARDAKKLPKACHPASMRRPMLICPAKTSPMARMSSRWKWMKRPALCRS